MNTADIAIIAAIAYQAFTGIRAGFAMGLFQLIVMIAGVLAALVLEEPVARYLEGVMPLDEGMRRLVTFFVITTAVSTVLVTLGGRLLARAMARQGRSRSVTVVDRVLGLIPAAARGVIYAGSLVFMARLALPPGHDIRVQLDGSRLAGIVVAIFEFVTPYARMF